MTHMNGTFKSLGTNYTLGDNEISLLLWHWKLSSRQQHRPLSLALGSSVLSHWPLISIILLQGSHQSSQYVQIVPPHFFILKYSIEMDFCLVSLGISVFDHSPNLCLTLSLKSEKWLQSWLEPEVKKKIVFKSFQKLKTHFKKNQGSVSLLYCNLAPSTRAPEWHPAGLCWWELWEPTSVFQRSLNIVREFLVGRGTNI